METVRLVFFGSTSDSLIVADRILSFSSPAWQLLPVAVVTQPPKPVGRKQIVTNTPVHDWAVAHKLPVLTFPSDPGKAWEYRTPGDVTNSISSFRPDLLVTACYGQKIPADLIQSTRFGGLNVHPSLLPRWRGADPLPWTILSGDAQTGATVSTLSASFDRGATVVQKKIPVPRSALPDELRTALFTLGADALAAALPDFLSGARTPTPQNPQHAVYARKLTREDGYVPRGMFITAIDGVDVPADTRPGLLARISQPLPEAVDRLARALTPWPGIWTIVPTDDGEKRLKILDTAVTSGKLVPGTVQLEGKKPVTWKQFRSAHLDIDW